MPEIKSRWDHTKVYRPNGTPYAQARIYVQLDDWPFVERAVSTGVQEAITKFVHEFGRRPNLERLVVEVVGATALVSVSVFELPREVR